MTFSNRKVDGRIFDVNHTIQSYLWASQLMLEDDFLPNLASGYAGVNKSGCHFSALIVNMKIFSGMEEESIYRD